MAVPARITIGSTTEEPEEALLFGLVKRGDGSWVIPDSFAGIAGAILDREAFLAEFPPKARTIKAIQHACTWFAYKMDDKDAKRPFMEHWMLASAKVEKGNLYSLPPMVMQEFDKFIDIDAADLHDLLLRFTLENEKLLQKQLRLDAAEMWAFSKAIELFSTPDPIIMDLLCASTKFFVKTAELPDRSVIIDHVLAHPAFTPAPSARLLNHRFSEHENYQYCTYQLNVGFVARQYVYAIFSPAPAFEHADWNAILDLPGITIRLTWFQGDLLNVWGLSRTYVGMFNVPAAAMDRFLAVFAAMRDGGMFAACEVHVLEDFMPAVNYNTYVPEPGNPRFTFDPVRDDPALFFAQHIDYTSALAEAQGFLARWDREDIGKLKKFIDKLTSTFSVKRARYDSWYSILAQVAEVGDQVVMRWLKLLSKDTRFLVPDPRAAYIFNPAVPFFTRVMALARSSMTVAERRDLATRFPISTSARTRSPDGEARTAWYFYVPQGQVEQAIDHVARVEPGARVAIDIFMPLVMGRYLSAAWYDGKGYDQVLPYLDAYADGAAKLAAGKMTVQQYRQSCYLPMQARVQSL